MKTFHPPFWKENKTRKHFIPHFEKEKEKLFTSSQVERHVSTLLPTLLYLVLAFPPSTFLRVKICEVERLGK